MKAGRWSTAATTMAAIPAALDRPALQTLLDEFGSGRIDIIVVYKVDRLTRSLADFAKLVELFDAHGVSFVSVTQSFNTTTSMGRLTLNMLLSFAQFEREVTGERIRDKIAASKRKGLWVGGVVPLGYKVVDRKLMIDEAEAPIVRLIFERYCALGSLIALMRELRERDDRYPAAGAVLGQDDRRNSLHQGAARLSPQEPDVSWRDQPRPNELSRRASRDHRSRIFERRRRPSPAMRRPGDIPGRDRRHCSWAGCSTTEAIA